MATWKMIRKIKQKERIGNALVFSAAFLVFLLVFGGLCLWAYSKINEEKLNSTSSGTSSSVSSESEAFTSADIRNLLVVTVDGTDAQGFLVIRSDPAAKKMWVLSFPRETVADVGTSEVKLCDLYGSQKISAVEEAMTSISGIHFNNYAVLTYDNYEKVLDHFDSGLVFDVPENVNSNDTVLKIDSGLRTLRSSQVTQLLRYSSWKDGQKKKAEIQSQIVAAMMNQYLRESRVKKMDADFSALINLVPDSDILISHYTDAKSGLTYLADNNDGSICQAMTLDGQYQGSGDALRYYAADDIQASLKSALGETS